MIDFDSRVGLQLFAFRRINESTNAIQLCALKCLDKHSQVLNNMSLAFCKASCD